MITLRTLTCHRDVSLASKCLGTLARTWREPYRLVIHEDGTLTDEDCAFLKQTLPGCEILRRADCRERVETALAKYPCARKYRSEHVFSNKLLDIPLLEPESAIHYIDSDIVFFRPFTGFFSGGGSICAREEGQGFCAKADLLMNIRGPIPQAFNAGLFRLPKAKHDLEFIEWFLSKPEFRVAPELVEQTIYALLFGIDDCRNFDTQQFIASQSPPRIGNKAISIHLLEWYLKQRADEFVRIADEILGLNPPSVSVLFQPVKRVTNFNRLARRAATLAGRLFQAG